MKHARTNRSGISLVIVAVLLVVIGSIAGVMVMRKEREAVWNPRTGSQTDLLAIKDALAAYQRTHHRLPCVAQRNLPASNANYGIEIPNCATLTAGPASTAYLNLGSGKFLRIGAVPHRTLGLTETSGEDEWSNRILYAVTESLTDPFQFTDGEGAITIYDGATPANAITSEAAFVVLSHGADGKGAFGAKATAVGKACNSSAGLDQMNCDDADAQFRATAIVTDTGATYFDDLVVWDKPDATAQASNRPCPSVTQGWLTNCAGTVPDVANGATSPTVNNSNPGYTGSSTFTCNDGTLTPNAPSCAVDASPPSCGDPNSCMDYCGNCIPNGGHTFYVFPNCRNHECVNGVLQDQGGLVPWACPACP